MKHTSPFATLLTKAIREAKLEVRPTPPECETPKTADPARLSAAVRRLFAETAPETLKDRERIMSPSARQMPTGFKTRSAIVGVCENVSIYGRPKETHWSYDPSQVVASETRYTPTKVLRIRARIAKRKAKAERIAAKAKPVKKVAKVIKSITEKKVVKKTAEKLTRNRK